MWGHKVRDVFPCLKSNPEAESRRRPRDEAPFIREWCKALRNIPRSSDLSRLERSFIGNKWWVPFRIFWWSVSAGHRRKFASNGIGRQARASWTTPSSRSPGGLLGTRSPSTTRPIERAWQTYPIFPAAAVIQKKWLCTPSTTVSGFARSGATSRSGRFASAPAARAARCWLRRGQCWASVPGWEACGVSRDPSCG